MPQYEFYRDHNSALHAQKAADFKAKGFRPIALAVYASPPDERYAALYTNQVDPDWFFETHSSIAAWKQSYEDPSAHPRYGARLISAAGTAKVPSIMTMWEYAYKSEAAIVTGQSAFMSLCNNRRNNAYRLESLGVFGDPVNPHFACIFVPSMVRWTYDIMTGRVPNPPLYQPFLPYDPCTTPNTPVDLSDCVAAHAQGRVRAALIVPIPGTDEVKVTGAKKEYVTCKYVLISRDDVLGEASVASPISVYVDLDGPTLDDVIATHAASGMAPVALGALMADQPPAVLHAPPEGRVEPEPERGGIQPGPRLPPFVAETAMFGAVFATTHASLNRVMGPHAGTPDPTFAAFDAFVEERMTEAGIRYAELAIVKDGRLVYVRSYAWAEPVWPLPLVVSPSRLASLSKPATAMALWKCYENAVNGFPGPKFNIVQQTMSDIFAKAGKKQFNNVDDVANGTQDISVYHLLSMAAGLRDFDTPDAMLQVLCVNKPHVSWPVSFHEYVDWIVNSPTVFDKDKNGSVYVYNNMSYVLAAYALEVITGKPYLDAMRDLVFGPMGLPDPVKANGRGPTLETGLLEAQAKNQLFHWDNIPVVQRSELRARRPLGPFCYSANYNRNLGSGSTVMCSVDYARILTMFAQQGAPIFQDPATLALALSTPPNVVDPNYNNAPTFVCNLGSSLLFDGAKNVIGLSKGGTYPYHASTRAMYWFADNVGIVVMFSGWALPFATSELRGYADAVTTWPADDLFQTYLWNV